MSLETLERDYRALAIETHQMITDPSLTVAEKRERNEKMEADLKALSDKIADARWVEEKANGLTPHLGPDAGAETPQPEAAETASFADVVNSQVFKDAMGRFTVDRRINTGPMEIKNATLTTGGLADANVVEQVRRPGVLPILFQRLTVADLMPNTAISSGNTWRSVVETTATNAASTVAEGGTKPEGAFDFDVVDEPVRKIAVIQKVADEALDDLAWMQQYLNGRLSLFVRIREEQQLLTGNGTAPDLEGILNRDLTAAQALGGDTIAIAVHKEITKVRVASFLDPDAIVFHPNDWQTARLEQDANDQFYGGGPFTGPYGVNGIAGDTYWGLRTVVTTAMTENTALVGAFATAAEVIRRRGLTVDMTNSDQDDFIKNLVTLRAEERIALAVYRPAAFGTVTGI